MSYEASVAAQRVGRVLSGKYRLDAVLGVGGMATVYRGTHRNGNRVAVKMLHPELSANDNICERFLREGYVANTVDHPGAVRVLDDDRDVDGAAYLIMELLEGESVKSAWERAGGRLPLQHVLAIAHQLLDVLAAAHAKGIVHRDIKPDNLFLQVDGRLKVLDFGIARLRDGSGASVTRTGGVLGTPGFMPREQVLGLVREIDGRTDLWSVGATIFTLLSGKLVHEGETPEQVIVHTATQPVQSLALAMPPAPAPLVSVVDRALAFDKNDRFPDARTMQAALAHARATIESGGTLPAPPLVEASSPAIAPVTGATPVLRPTPHASTTSGVSARSTAIARPSRAALWPLGAVAAIVLAAGITWGVSEHGTKAPPGPAGSTAGSPPPGETPLPSAPHISLPPPETPPTPSVPTPQAADEPEAGASPPPSATPTSPAPTHGGPSVHTSGASSSQLVRDPRPPPSNCDPPWFIDPVTHSRKVKPGC
jgi:serine/threonine-protein kinase